MPTCHAKPYCRHTSASRPAVLTPGATLAAAAAKIAMTGPASAVEGALTGVGMRAGLHARDSFAV